MTDDIIKATNAMNKDNIEFIYSTPSGFLKALNQENIEFTSHREDFFPYMREENGPWSGYYSSRPGFKKQVVQAT